MFRVAHVTFNPYDDFIFFDSCAFDGGNLHEQDASNKARRILEMNGKRVTLMHSVVSEIRHPNTPHWLQKIEPESFQTVRLNLSDQEMETLNEIERVIVGNGNVEKRKADCSHVFEAQKYGGCFVTTDEGIYKHAIEIKQKYGLNIVKPTAFLKLVIEYSEKT
jgi:predicted DNA-binding protein (UPF0278 family)